MLPALAFSLTVAALITCVVSDIPLVDKHFPWDQIPYQADTEIGVRGPQAGYNICNSTTEGPHSLCQTMIFNDLEDFCFLIPQEPNSIIGNVEGETITACTKKGHGARLVPEGTFKGIQFTTTPDYIQIAAFIDQTKVNLQGPDYGGEMDSGGADGRGNAIGSLVYTNAFSDDKKTMEQANSWTEFIGGGFICMKVCNNKRPNAKRYCEHIYDRIGCKFNVPNNVQEGVFETCDADNMDFVGQYTLPDGTTTTWYQPGEGTEPVPPYVPKTPASSNCKPTPSAQIWTDAIVAVATPTATTSQGANAVNGAGNGSSRPVGSGPSATGSTAKSTASTTPVSAARAVTASGSSFIGAFLAMIFFI